MVTCIMLNENKNPETCIHAHTHTCTTMYGSMYKNLKNLENQFIRIVIILRGNGGDANVDVFRAEPL